MLVRTEGKKGEIREGGPFEILRVCLGERIMQDKIKKRGWRKARRK